MLNNYLQEKEKPDERSLESHAKDFKKTWKDEIKNYIREMENGEREKIKKLILRAADTCHERWGDNPLYRAIMDCAGEM